MLMVSAYIHVWRKHLHNEEGKENVLYITMLELHYGNTVVESDIRSLFTQFKCCKWKGIEILFDMFFGKIGRKIFGLNYVRHLPKTIHFVDANIGNKFFRD